MLYSLVLHNKLAQPQEIKKTKTKKNNNCLFINSTVYGFENKNNFFEIIFRKRKKKKNILKVLFFPLRNLSSSF